MKRIFLLIFAFINLSILAQNVNWGLPFRTEENFYSNTKHASGKYLGEVDGSKYYIVYSPFAKAFGMSTNVKLFFISETNDSVTKVTKYSELVYDILDVKILNNSIAVFYIEHSKTSDKIVKIDYYNLKTFTKQTTETLFNYKIKEKDFSKFNLMLTSEDNTKMAFITYCLIEDTPSLLFHVYDKELSELYIQEKTLDYEKYISFDNALLTNNGEIVFNFLNFNSEEFEKVIGLQFFKVNSDNIDELNTDMEFSNRFCSSSWIEKDNRNMIFVYTTENSISGININFFKEEISDVFTQNYYEGNWKIEKLLKLKNGNIVSVVADKTYTIIYNQKSPNVHAYTYKNYSFDCFDPESSNLVYHNYLGRKFQWGFLMPEQDPFLTMPISVFAKGNEVYAIYNTDRKTNDVINEENENKKKKSFSYNPSIKSITKLAIIDETGMIQTNFLFDYKEAKGQCATIFTFLENEKTVKISKIFRKYITFGTINL